MIIRKPTKIELKPEDDFDEYEAYKEEQHQQLSKLNRNQEHNIGLSQFGGPEFALHGGHNRLFGAHQAWQNNRPFIGDQLHPSFHTAFQNDLSYSYMNMNAPNGPGSSVNGFGIPPQGQYERVSGNPIDGGNINQLFSALIGNPGMGAMRVPGVQNPPQNPTQSNNQS